jgi:hypothetical protein
VSRRLRTASYQALNNSCWDSAVEVDVQLRQRVRNVRSDTSHIKRAPPAIDYNSLREQARGMFGVKEPAWFTWDDPLKQVWTNDERLVRSP